MQEFVDEIIKYLDSKFDADTNITSKPKGHYAYEKGLEPTATTPFYTVQLMDDSTASEDFNREVAYNSPIQFNLYGVKMKVKGKLENAQSVSFYLAEQCKKFMEEYKYSSKRITTMRRTASTPALPYGDGSKAYYSVIRYNITLKEI